MALIVEDGTQVAGANSYASLDTIKAYAVARGVTLGIDSIITTQVLKAMDYLEGKRKDYQGNKVAVTQSLQFPRINVVIDDFEFPSTSIPSMLIQAECQLVIEQSLGIDFMPTMNEPTIKSETIGPIKTEYAVNPGAIFEPFSYAVNALLEPLFKSGSNAFGVTFLRV